MFEIIDEMYKKYERTVVQMNNMANGPFVLRTKFIIFFLFFFVSVS